MIVPLSDDSLIRLRGCLREASDRIEQLTRERDEALALFREVSAFTVDMPDDWWAKVKALLERTR